MTRNPYRSALGALAASVGGLGALIWLLSSVALTGIYRDDPGVLVWNGLSGWLFIAAFVFLVAWLVICAVTYRAPETAEASSIELPAQVDAN